MPIFVLLQLETVELDLQLKSPLYWSDVYRSFFGAYEENSPPLFLENTTVTPTFVLLYLDEVCEWKKNKTTLVQEWTWLCALSSKPWRNGGIYNESSLNDFTGMDLFAPELIFTTFFNSFTRQSWNDAAGRDRWGSSVLSLPDHQNYEEMLEMNMNHRRH